MSEEDRFTMIRTFVRLHEFEKQCKNIGLDEDDVIEIENILLENPAVGVVMRGTGGVRKFRLALPGRGKSGGARVVYIDFLSCQKIYLLTVFAKSELDNLSQEERNELKALVRILESELRKKER
jgi:hypothetical protein